jgi:hypothetical protein
MDVCPHIIEGVRQDATILLDGVLVKTESAVFAEKQSQINASIRHKIRRRLQFMRL